MEKIYNIKDFGARMCDQLQTKEIQSAIDAAFLAGGGKVVVPTGVFYTGCLRLRSNVTLYLEAGAQLRGSRNPDDYENYLDDEIEPIDIHKYDEWGTKGSVNPYSHWCNALIRIIDAENVAIIGEKGSYIDGRNPYDPIGEEGYRGPHGISAWYCKNLKFEGYTFNESGNWCHAVFRSQDIEFKNLTILGGHDGIDLRTCDNVLIEDCTIYSSDDCVAGFDNHDVVIKGCDLNTSCSVFRFGGNGILIENCKAEAPGRYSHKWGLSEEKKKLGELCDENCRRNTHTPFLYYCDFRAVIRKAPGNILIRNCEFAGCDSPFMLQFDGEHVWCCNRSLSQIKFENCKITDVNEPIQIHGDEKEPLTFELENVEITAREGYEDISFAEARNFAKLSFKNVTVKGFKNPVINRHTDGEVEIENCQGF
ncbi:MAG: right-handed parallel beta-helix repeat-containing protein [Clostridia bacterium]|nr:right-handed parallel beta-helix repeat-containing protein [Clostridia bacterium]